MLNILSLNCGLAFAPYLVESLSAFLSEGTPLSRVIRQGGSGLIIRSEDLVTLRYQNRQVELGGHETRHYVATVKFRADSFEIRRTSDEVVLASFGSSLLISHPQSELWLDAGAVQHLLQTASSSPANLDPVAALPDWLNVSAGAGQLLISDQRNGRWVLLGSDHISELESRVAGLVEKGPPHPVTKPPTILLKGVAVHLQSAVRLLKSLQAFGKNGLVLDFEEVTPSFSLRVARSIEGIELSDSNSRTGITAREARKWTALVKEELVRLRVTQVERGLIRTVFADGEGGRWVLQWGDEILIPSGWLSSMKGPQFDPLVEEDGPLSFKRDDGVVLMLSRHDGACVALSLDELEILTPGPLLDN